MNVDGVLDESLIRNELANRFDHFRENMSKLIEERREMDWCGEC